MTVALRVGSGCQVVPVGGYLLVQGQFEVLRSAWDQRVKQDQV